MLSTPVIAAAEAISLLGQAIVLDVRVGSGASEAFEAGHLPGAICVDIESDLSDLRDPSTGGRHPLPSLDHWLARLGGWGVTPTSEVLIYDAAGGGMAAARAWWMLRAIGHVSVAVVDGGWQALLQGGAPTEAGVTPALSVGPYRSQLQTWPNVDAAFVDRVRGDPAWRLIDVRAPERYAGTTEPLDPVAGHIPGARNLYWQSQLDDQGLFKAVATLQQRYAEVLGDVPAERVVCYCGSGVTACHLLLAMEACGLSGAQLYVGSWSEWCRQQRPRAPG